MTIKFSIREQKYSKKCKENGKKLVKKFAVASKKLAKIHPKNSRETGTKTSEEGVRGM